jgi:hypothetical protein
VLVLQYSQRIYDDPNDLKYEYTINYVLKDGWELVKKPVIGESPYAVNKMSSADKIADATKETIYTLSLKKKIVEESNQSEDNSAEAKYHKAEYKIIVYTPSIHLTLHAPSTHGGNDKIMKRPTTKEADTVKDFDTGYLGIMLRNEDNDDGDPIPEDPNKPLPRDNDDKKPGSKDDDLVAVLLELNHDYTMPDELKAMINLNLAFKTSTEEIIRVFDEDKAAIPHAEFTKPKQLSDSGNDKHLSKLINDGSTTIYLEGLGSSEDPQAARWGDNVDQITLKLTPGADYKEATSHGLLLYMALAVDRNRDTLMSFKADDLTSSEKPYVFWLNNDSDTVARGNIDKADDRNPSSAPADNADDKILSIRDLEDFTRMDIGVTAILDKLITGEFKLGLRMIGGAGEIKTWRNLSPFGTQTYLVDEDIARLHLNLTDPGHIKPGSTYMIDKDFWTSDSVSNGKGRLLFEGFKEGEGEIALELYSKDEKKGAIKTVTLSLRKIEELYEHWTLGDNTTSDPNRVATQLNSLDISGLDVDPQNNYILFVHGWNMAPWERRTFAETAYKRLYWQRYKGRFGLFGWPTETGLPSYDRSERKAWLSGSGLKQTLFSLNSKHKLTVLAHSMGNIVVSEALRLRVDEGGDPIISDYLASQAASVAHAYDATGPFLWQEDSETDTPEVYANYPLISLPYFHNIRTAVSGKIVNLYNEEDFALNASWKTNQNTKPDNNYDYEFLRLPTPGMYYTYKPRTAIQRLTFPRDRARIFAHISEARSYALGDESKTGVEITGSVNLNTAPHEYGNGRHEHSAQFRSVIMKRRDYWQYIMSF